MEGDGGTGGEDRQPGCVVSPVLDEVQAEVTMRIHKRGPGSSKAKATALESAYNDLHSKLPSLARLVKSQRLISSSLLIKMRPS